MSNRNMTSQYLFIMILLFVGFQITIVVDYPMQNYPLFAIAGFLAGVLIYLLVPKYWRVKFFFEKGLTIEGVLFSSIFFLVFFFPLLGIIFLLIVILSYMFAPGKWKMALLSKFPPKWLQDESMLSIFMYGVFIYTFLLLTDNTEYTAQRMFVASTVLISLYALEIVNRKRNRKDDA